MAMTKNIRTTINAVSKLFAITNETHKRMADVKNAENVKESIEASKVLNNFSKRVDRLCAKLGFERDVIDAIFAMSEGDEDNFVLSVISINEYAFSAYNACVDVESLEDEVETLNDESAE